MEAITWVQPIERPFAALLRALRSRRHMGYSRRLLPFDLTSCLDHLQLGFARFARRTL